MKTVYTLGREVAKCVSIKTTVSAQSTIIVRLPHATLTAPNLLLGNCKRFVGHKLSTICADVLQVLARPMKQSIRHM